MEPHEQEPGKGQKIASYRGHRRGQRKAERTLGSMPLDQAIAGGVGELQDAKDTHETAAGVIKRDLTPNPPAHT
ncbi:hypothetical protein HYU96_03680 [Candidatus Daviesbacteria bacterium]|nr:hypothetical protein [Candidatus Daviesbacteria bacterium]